MKKLDFGLAIGSCLQHITDGSLKVGIQGLDSNRWRIDEVLTVLEAYATFANVVLTETGLKVAPTDVWGGGQVSQAPRFLGEDPYRNLEKMWEIAPDLHFKCIYRGRQAFGFLPCSEEVQTAAIYEAANCGMRVFRMFDPLNDANNLIPALNAIRAYRSVQIADGVDASSLVSAEALVFYIRPDEDAETVWDQGQLSRYAVGLATMGFHEVSLADYAEQLTDHISAAATVRHIRYSLDTAGFSAINLNFFAQGERPLVNKAALDAGAATVDTAIGKLSGGMSNTNIRPLLKALMMEKGHDIDSRLNRQHPILKALRRVETVIDKYAQSHIPYRMSSSTLDGAMVGRSRLALNAVSALHSAIEKNWSVLIEPIIPDEWKTKSSQLAHGLYLQNVLNESYQLWKRGGQFHPVSPFGYVCSFQAEAIVRARMCGRTLPLGHYKVEFQDLLKGRYGNNVGVAEGKCDQTFIHSFHIYEALDLIRTSYLQKSIGQDVVENFLHETNLLQYFDMDQNIFSENLMKFNNLRNEEKLESVLSTCDFSDFSNAIVTMKVDNSLHQKLQFALSSAPFSLPSGELDEARETLSNFEREECFEFSTVHPTSQRLSERERAVMSLVLYKINSPDPYAIGKNLFRFIQSGSTKLHGDIEPDIRPLDKIFQHEIGLAAEIIAKERLLRRAAWNGKVKSKRNLATCAALGSLREKKLTLYLDVFSLLTTAGFSKASQNPRFSVTTAMRKLRKLARSAANERGTHLKKIPPLHWKETAITSKKLM